MKIILFANTDWYLYNFRRPLALAAQAAGYEVVLVSPPGPYGERLQKLGLRWIPARMERRSLNPMRELGLLGWLWRLARAEKADIVHGFTIKCAVYGALAARLSGAVRVNAIAGMGYVFISDEPRARMLRPAVRAIMRVAFGGARSRLILQNPEDVEFFAKRGIAARNHINLIPGSGVDCERFLPPTTTFENSGPLRVVLAARMLWDKGVREFIEAAKILKSEGRNVCFVLAGLPDPGNPASIPEDVLRGWRVAGLAEWLGHVEDMPALLAGADIVALPSYREGLPKSLIEAASCGRPLITTDVPGCRAVVTDGADGLLVPVRDAGALARAVARLHDDPRLACRLGKAARARALGEFDERLIVGRTLEVYRELLAERAAQSAFAQSLVSRLFLL